MKTFGKYQLFEEIGKSPAGTTYQATDQLSGRAVVVKSLNSAGLAPEAKARLCHELTACAEFQHPNIVRILDTGEIDGAIYVATELLQGTDLRRHLLDGSKMPLVRKLRIMAQIYDGLALAHQKQITHGGIKPANIFLADQDEAKILDFGIAKLSGQPDSIASDLFFTAAVLYEFVTGIAPFETPFEPKALRKVDAQIPEDLDRLVTSALAKDPQHRPQTAEIMAASLCAIAKQLLQPAEPMRAQTVSVSAPLAATAAAGASSAMKSTAVPSTPAAVSVVSKPEPVASAAPKPAREVSLEAGRAEPAAAAKIPPIAEKAPPAPITPKNSPVAPAAVPKRSPVRVGIVVAASAILALFIMAGLLSKQTSNATPSKPVQAPAAVSAPAIENTTPVTQPPAVPAQVVADELKAEPVAAAAGQILTGQIQTLWESGEYARALTLVDAILAAEPANAEGLAWKKKIRTAQQAEAALR